MYVLTKNRSTKSQVKMSFLEENRVKVMDKQLKLFHDAVIAYYSGGQFFIIFSTKKNHTVAKIIALWLSIILCLFFGNLSIINLTCKRIFIPLTFQATMKHCKRRSKSLAFGRRHHRPHSWRGLMTSLLTQYDHPHFNGSGVCSFASDQRMLGTSQTILG